MEFGCAMINSKTMTFMLQGMCLIGQASSRETTEKSAREILKDFTKLLKAFHFALRISTSFLCLAPNSKHMTFTHSIGMCNLANGMWISSYQSQRSWWFYSQSRMRETTQFLTAWPISNTMMKRLRTTKRVSKRTLSLMKRKAKFLKN